MSYIKNIHRYEICSLIFYVVTYCSKYQRLIKIDTFIYSRLCVPIHTVVFPKIHSMTFYCTYIIYTRVKKIFWCMSNLFAPNENCIASLSLHSCYIVFGSSNVVDKNRTFNCFIYTHQDIIVLLNSQVEEITCFIKDKLVECKLLCTRYIHRIF